MRRLSPDITFVLTKHSKLDNKMEMNQGKVVVSDYDGF